MTGKRKKGLENETKTEEEEERGEMKRYKKNNLANTKG